MQFKFSYYVLLSVACASVSHQTLANSSDVATQPLAESQLVDAKTLLMKRLAQTSFFSANFTQQVFDEEHNTLQQSQGKLMVKKPSLVYWQTTQPDASLIVSDGDNLWFYDPLIEQATVYSVDASLANTPILLLTSTDENLWQQYNISQQQSDVFVIESKDANSRVAQLTLTFAKNSGQLISFTLLDSTGQTSIVSLAKLDDTTEINDEMFEFTAPEGTYLVDQR